MKHITFNLKLFCYLMSNKPLKSVLNNKLKIKILIEQVNYKMPKRINSPQT